jgi:hypothetical protein
MTSTNLEFLHSKASSFFFFILYFPRFLISNHGKIDSAFLCLERIFMWYTCIKKCGPLLTKHIVIVNTTKHRRNHVNKQNLKDKSH